MTLLAFDIGLVKNYNEKKYLLHFQWNDGKEKVYRYALVEEIDLNKIDHKLKIKEDEVSVRGESKDEQKYK